MKTKLTGIILLLFSLSGCVKETLDKCPEGNISIQVYAEKFRTNSEAPTQDSEPQIDLRIHTLYCVLYKDDVYVSDTFIDNLSTSNASYYPIDFNKLPFGNYKLMLIGNAPAAALQGDYHQWGDLKLLYSAPDHTNDLFAALLPFTVDCNCTTHLQTKLRRLLGVVKCEFKNLPQEVSEVEVILHHVNSRLEKGGAYTQPTSISKRVATGNPSSSDPLDILLGTFPPDPSTPAAYELKLYTPGKEAPFFSQIISERIPIYRNQLTELITEISDGKIHFMIRLDTAWDDYIDGGEIEIN